MWPQRTFIPTVSPLYRRQKRFLRHFHRPIRAITTKFGPVSLEKEVSHAETPDLLQIHTKSQTSCGRKEYLCQLYLHFIAATIGSSGITSPNLRHCYKVWPRLTRKGSKPRRNPDLLQIHTKFQTPCGRKEYLFQFYLHFITVAIGSCGITTPNSRYYVWICKRSGVSAWLTSFSSETAPNFVAIARIGRCDAGGTDHGSDKVVIKLE